MCWLWACTCASNLAVTHQFQAVGKDSLSSVNLQPNLSHCIAVIKLVHMQCQRRVHRFHHGY